MPLRCDLSKQVTRRMLQPAALMPLPDLAEAWMPNPSRWTSQTRPSIKAAIDTVEHDHGSVGILINNAGVGLMRPDGNRPDSGCSQAI